MTSADLIWQLVKTNNRYLVKRNGNSNASITFSSEPNNLYNLNSFKYSGLANGKTVSIAAAGEGLDVVLGTTKTRKRHRLAESVNQSHLKRDFRKMAKAVVNQVATNGYRPDLKNASLARLSSVHKSLRKSLSNWRETKAGASQTKASKARKYAKK